MTPIIIGPNLAWLCRRMVGSKEAKIRVVRRSRFRREGPHRSQVHKSIFVGIDWLKLTFPVEFATMVFSSEGSFDILEISQSEALRRTGQPLLPL